MQKRILNPLSYFPHPQHTQYYQNRATFLPINFKLNSENPYQNQNPRFPLPDYLNFGTMRDNSNQYIPPPMTFCMQNANLEYRKLLMQIRSSPHFNPQSFLRMKNFLLGCRSFQSQQYPFARQFQCQKQSSHPNQSFFQQNLVKLEQPQADMIEVQMSKDQEIKLERQRSFENCVAQDIPASNTTQRTQKQLIRRKKVIAYLERRKYRTFNKKIIYMCRKNVADNRIRHKGRFINSEQAKAVLGLKKGFEIPAQQLKKLIYKLQNKEETKKKQINI